MPEPRLTYLLYRHFRDVASEEEREELMLLLDDPVNEHELLAVLDDSWESFSAGVEAFTPTQSRRILNGVLPAKQHYLKNWVAVAAVLAALVASCWLLFRSRLHTEKAIVSRVYDAKPGTTGAVLTLADGSTLSLDSAAEGTLRMEGTTRLVTQKGKLVYRQDKTAQAGGILYNMLTTARGKQFHVTLPDGTKVWLNAQSSLRYPTAFTGKQRRVEITGEVYMEIAPDAEKPFLVNGGGQEIRVLGTSFNLNAYTDEKFTRTTLLEGAVQVNLEKESLVLKPGEQAQARQDGGRQGTPILKRVANVDVDAVVAWKNGSFSFRHADIRTLTRQLARWYDVNVEFRGRVDESQSFTGEIGRDLPLSDVLNGLQLTRIHYQIENKKLIILP